MKKNRGGQIKYWSDKAKIIAWYNRIHWVERCSDYELDNKYAYINNNSPQDNLAQRSRIFEGIRSKARIPRAYKEGVRSLNEIVDEVRKTEGLEDTLDIFYAEIWELFKKSVFSSTEIKSSIDDCLSDLKLERVNPEKSILITNIIRQYGIKSVFDRCIRVSLLEKDSLKTLPLLWFIYVQANSPHVAFVREVVELLIDEKIDNLFRYYFDENQYQIFYSKAINQLINTSLETSDVNASGYGWDIEVVATWPILPKDFTDFDGLFHQGY